MWVGTHINLIFKEDCLSLHKNSKFESGIQGYQNCTWKVKNMAYVDIEQWIRVHPKLRSSRKVKKLQPKYGSSVGSRSRVCPPNNELRWDIDGTGARDGVGP